MNLSISDIFAFLQSDTMYIILGVIVLGLSIALYRAHKDKQSPIALQDLVTTNNKLDEAKLTRFGAFLISSWGFVYLASTNALSEWYFIGYMAGWVANGLISKDLNIKREKQGTSEEQPPQG
jgi:hypothetical protein